MFVKNKANYLSDRYIKWSLLFISLLFLIALSLRLWGIWNVSHTDEYNEVLEALRVCSGHFNFERWVKRFYLYILAIEYGVYYIIGWLFKTFANPMDFAEKIIRNMNPLFILARITSAIAGAWTVVLLYKVGDRIFNKRVATVASLLLTFTVFHVDLSQNARVDALLGLLVVITFYFISKLLDVKEATQWDYAWCGFFMALAIQTKVNTIVLLIPFIIAAFHNYRKSRSYPSLSFFSTFFVLGLVIGNPPVLLAPFKFLRNILALGRVYTTPINVVPIGLIGFFAYPLYYFRSMGMPVTLLTILAILYAIFRLDWRRSILLGYIIAFYVLMGASENLSAPYYMIPVVPAIFLLIGDLMDEIANKLLAISFISQKKVLMLYILILVIMLIIPIRNVARHEISLSGKNTRYIAKEWIESNIPEGSKILMDSGKSFNSFAPPIAENRENLEKTIAKAKQNIDAGRIVHEIVDMNALIYYELLLKTVPKKSYDITSTMFGLEVKSVDYYISNYYQYIVISENLKKERTNNFFSERHPEIAEFYKSLDIDRRIKLIKTINPTLLNWGDTFYIYKIMNNIEMSYSSSKRRCDILFKI